MRDKLSAQLLDMTFNSQEYAPQTLEGNVNYFVEDISDELKTIANFSFSAINAFSRRNDIQETLNADVLDATYLSKQYLTAAEALTLAQAVATKANGITLLTLNGEAMASSMRDDQTPSSSFTPGIGEATEGLEVYIFGCEYKNQSYLSPSGADNASDFLVLINNALDTVSSLEYSSCIAVSSCDQNDNKRIFVGVSQASYSGDKHFPSTTANTLRNAIMNALDSINDVTYSQVQIRCSKHDNQPSENY